VEIDRIRYDQTDSEVNTSIFDVAQSDRVETVDVNEKKFNGMIRDAYNRLSPFKKALIGLGVGKWYIGSYKKSAWNGKLPFYAWKCQACGKITFSYPHSHRKNLQCQNCTHALANTINSAIT